MRWTFVLLAGWLGSSALAQPVSGQQFFGAPADQVFTPAQTSGPPPSATDVLVAEPPPLWSGSADLGLNGATGNAERFNRRTGFAATRKTADNLLTADFLYTYTRTGGLVGVNQPLFNARDERLYAGTPWLLFASTQVEYDQLRDYRFRVGVYAGVGYAVIDTPDVGLKLRAGAGVVREIGSNGLASRWVPELIFGEDFRYRFSDTDSFVSSVDFYPRVDDFTQFRVRAGAAYEHVISPASGMLVRLGAQDRYDSNPGNNSKKNDLTYFVTFGVKF